MRRRNLANATRSLPGRPARWDRLREETFARQKQLGVIPQDAELTKRHDEIPAWDDEDEAFKPVLARQMENYAGFLEYADHHVGRVIDALDALGVLQDTLIYYIIGDNGASAEGTLTGHFNAMIGVNGGDDLIPAPGRHDEAVTKGSVVSRHGNQLPHPDRR
jgi:arylsulfatase A-like enzyme